MQSPELSDDPCTSPKPHMHSAGCMQVSNVERGTWEAGKQNALTGPVPWRSSVCLASTNTALKQLRHARTQDALASEHPREATPAVPACPAVRAVIFLQSGQQVTCERKRGWWIKASDLSQRDNDTPNMLSSHEQAGVCWYVQRRHAGKIPDAQDAFMYSLKAGHWAEVLTMLAELLDHVHGALST